MRVLKQRLQWLWRSEARRALENDSPGRGDHRHYHFTFIITTVFDAIIIVVTPASRSILIIISLGVQTRAIRLK